MTQSDRAPPQVGKAFALLKSTLPATGKATFLAVPMVACGLARIGTNPEQLFAAGWSACFESAIGIVAHKMKVACRRTLPLTPK
jgi:organic hydroperoxide reductase OsmC/OhrA